MVDIPWPSDLAPYKVAFYLQPHVGGSESPMSRVRKVYGLSAPRWVARLTFRGGYDGAPLFGEHGGFGARLDSLIADLDGGLNKAVFHDWRRPYPSAGLTVVGTIRSTGAPKGASAMTVTGFAPYARAMSVGDYINGGDGRPHIVSAAMTLAAGGSVSGAGTIIANAAGEAVVGFRPPLRAAMPAATSLVWPVTGRFELVDSDGAGANETAVGSPSEYILDFTEALL